MLGAIPIATPARIEPDNRGLLTVSRYNDGEVADAVLAAWSGGQIKGQSFSGSVHNDRELGEREGIPHIERTELGLREYGPTHSPAYDGDGLVMIRSADDLAELVRSMIHDIAAGTPLAPSAAGSTGSTSSQEPTPVTDSGTAHSSRNKRLAVARAAKFRLEHIHDQATLG
jgi:hypothetical protein